MTPPPRRTLLLGLPLLVAACHPRPAPPSHPAPAPFTASTGSLTEPLHSPLARVTDAARSAMHDMGYAIADEVTSSHDARFEAREADDARIAISLTRRSTDTTDVHIDVGSDGSEAKARMILDKLKARLAR